MDPLGSAVARLNTALNKVESRLRTLQTAARQDGDSDNDRARLAEALDEARARESEMAEAAREASKALGDAIEELREAARSAQAEAGNG